MKWQISKRVPVKRTHHTYVIDLGISTKIHTAKGQEERVAREAHMYYTTPYRPPEFWRCKSNLDVLYCLKPSADVWAAGCTLLEANTGVRLFGGKSAQSEVQVGRQILDFGKCLRQSGATVLKRMDSGRWGSLVSKCLRPSPADRPSADLCR